MNKQMNNNAMRKQADTFESKRLIPTSFGPSEDEDIVIKKLMIHNHKKMNAKNDLTSQIEEKAMTTHMNR